MAVIKCANCGKDVDLEDIAKDSSTDNRKCPHCGQLHSPNPDGEN